MNRVYWEIRAINEKTDEVWTVFEGGKREAISRGLKLARENKDSNVWYELKKWTAERYWDGMGWDFEDYELENTWDLAKEGIRTIEGISIEL